MPPDLPNGRAAHAFSFTLCRLPPASEFEYGHRAVVQMNHFKLGAYNSVYSHVCI